MLICKQAKRETMVFCNPTLSSFSLPKAELSTVQSGLPDV